jgi:chorismate synthase
MASNSIGTLFRLSTFGESHGPAIGGIIDGCPAGMQIDFEAIQREMDRRKPGQSPLTTQRKETDVVQWLSGLFEGKTTGTPIAFLLPNENQHSKDYDALANTFRPGHADYTYNAKFGLRDHRGGGRASARETAARVAAGAVARQLLSHWGIGIQAYVSSVHTIEVPHPYTELDLALTETNPLRCPHPETATQMQAAIEKAKEDLDSLGGIITCIAKGVPAGIGEPVFDKLHAELGKAMLGINAVKGIEFGDGFAASRKKGSENNDQFQSIDGHVATTTNHSGGLLGGISNGQDVWFRVAFKPVSSIGKPQSTIDSDGNAVQIEIGGRHDPCVLPRAVPIVEAMAALVLVDHLLRTRAGAPLVL